MVVFVLEVDIMVEDGLGVWVGVLCVGFDKFSVGFLYNFLEFLEFV